MKSFVIPDDGPAYGEPGPDFRANAWVGAWDRIELAQKLKLDRDKRPVDVLPERYWATMLEAAILAHLATADEDPGRDAGSHLVDRAHRIAEQRTRIENRFGEKVRDDQGADEPPHPLLTLLDKRVRINAGDFKGELGTVTAAYPTNMPPLVDVDLDNGQTIVVLPTQIDDQGVE